MNNNEFKFKKISAKNIKKDKYYHRSDLDYMKSLSSAVLEKSTIGSRLVLWTIMISIAFLILWAYYAELDERVRGQAKVIPAKKVQVIQNLEGGIVEDIFVKDGDIVKVNQPLIKLQDILLSSSRDENKVKIYELKAKIARLYAQAYNKPFSVNDKNKNEFLHFISNEKSLYESSLKQLRSSLDVISSQLNQRKSELIEARAKRKQLKKSLTFIDKEIKIKEPLAKRGVISNVDLIQLQRQQNDLRGELEAVVLSIPRIQSTIEEQKQKYSETKLAFQNKSKQELNDAEAQLQGTLKSISALSNRVHRTVVRSPVAGTVKKLFANTIGGVVGPGSDIVEIIPNDDSLLLVAKIKPSDIAFLFVGQEATIKITAYDFSIYGGLKGKVVNISPDTIMEEDKKIYYEVQIKADKNYLTFKGKKLYIKVGMVASTDILTGKKTVLDYILKPILKAKNTALRER